MECRINFYILFLFLFSLHYMIMILHKKWFFQFPIQKYSIVLSQKLNLFSSYSKYHTQTCCIFHWMKPSICLHLRNTEKNFYQNKLHLPRSFNCDPTIFVSICPYHTSEKSSSYALTRYYSSTTDESKKTTPANEPVDTKAKPSLLQKFKQMYKEYWYVLVPVHLITSAFWFTSFYYLSKSGVDIASVLESIGAGENLIEKLRNKNSTIGYIAISYALYKIATPIRYTVTLGGTTLTIKYLKDYGYIKPIPPPNKLKEIIHEKKDILIEKKENLKIRYKDKGFLYKILIKLKLKKEQDRKD